MPLTPCSVATNNIATVGTSVAGRGLTTDQFKALFDKYGVDFVAWFNATHLAEGHMAESGSNANGSYIKFTDGTMICTTEIIAATTVGLSSIVATVTLPASFIDTNYRWTGTQNALHANMLYSALVIGQNNIKTTSNFNVSIKALANFDTVVAVGVSIIAVGRWKA